VGLLPAVQSLLTVLTVSLFVMTFTVQPIRIPSGSMEPTLLVGDFMLMNKQMVEGNGGGLLPPVSISRGDVVVFHDPVDDPSVHLVKRVIGVPGDRIHLRDGVVYRNGEALQESYAIHREAAEDRYRDDFPDLETMQARVNPGWWIRMRSLVHDGEITVPPESFFVMGDNRNNSEDSRYWGFVPRDAIVGKPVLIYFSWRVPTAENDDRRWPGRQQDDGLTAQTNFARWDRTFRVVR
jgi:signal peptidase I